MMVPCHDNWGKIAYIEAGTEVSEHSGVSVYSDIDSTLDICHFMDTSLWKLDDDFTIYSLTGSSFNIGQLVPQNSNTTSILLPISMS